MRFPSIVLLLAVSCTLTHEPLELDSAFPEVDAKPPQATAGLPDAEPSQAIASLPDFEPAPAASSQLVVGDLPTELDARIDSWFEGHGTRRMHVQLDRPLYKPGETVWVKTWSVATRGLAPDEQYYVTYDLVNPRGLVVETKNVLQERGAATNDFVLGDDVPGGKWTLRATLPTGEVDERPFVVSSYQTPRIRKQLEFVREA
ncbi:MAG: hypothetical protein JRI25_22760, partial [Deltaproteobacteria bacterium]|nr:hypothetical protein [Deltaproteobacteria bacterium]